MNENIIIAIAIGTGTGVVITLLVVLAYRFWARNGDSEHHGCCARGKDIEQNEHSTTQETSSNGSDRDFVVELGEVDTISSLTPTLPTGIDIMVHTLAKEWRNGDIVHDGVATRHSPRNSPKKIPATGDLGSVGTIKINNFSKKGQVDDCSVWTPKVNNCTVINSKPAIAVSSTTYLSGQSLTIHNEKFRNEL